MRTSQNNYFMDYTQQLEQATREALKGISSPYEIRLNYVGHYEGNAVYMTSKGLTLNSKPSKLELSLMETD